MYVLPTPRYWAVSVGVKKILLPTLSVRIVLDSLLIGESHLLLYHPLLVGVLGTSFGAEACNRSLSQKTISTPLADSFNFNVATHFVGVNFALICSCASVDVRLRPQTSTTLLTLGVKWVAVVQNPYKIVHKNARHWQLSASGVLVRIKFYRSVLVNYC